MIYLWHLRFSGKEEIKFIIQKILDFKSSQINTVGIEPIFGEDHPQMWEHFDLIPGVKINRNNLFPYTQASAPGIELWRFGGVDIGCGVDVYMIL